MDSPTTSFPPPPPLTYAIHHAPHPPQSYRLPDLPSHPALDLGDLDTNDPTVFHAHTHHQLQRTQPAQPAQPVQVVQDAFTHDVFNRDSTPAHLHHHQSPSETPTAGPIHHRAPPPAAAPPPHSTPPSQGQFSILTPETPLQSGPALGQLPQDDDLFPAQTTVPSTPEVSEPRPHGQLVSRIVVDPPDLQEWRDRLFNVNETIILTNEEFETYFPHIDNVYSHRSTQKYKRKPFISHYWDCRMKGRPPGTPKSDDPTKKKRKRSARERDLCDVKIKITEYFPGAGIQLDSEANPPSTPTGGFSSSPQNYGEPNFGNANLSQLSASGEKFWTIQRVNGNGGNGKGDGVAGPHKHTLERSDEIKKSSVQRYIVFQNKGAKKTAPKSLQRKPSGAAAMTARKHSREHDLKLYAACFCPYSQRVWIALEAKGISYQYCEVDPFKRSTALLEANPRGLVPAIREGDWASGESAIILEYLEDVDHQVPLFPTDPRLRANCRLWIDHIESKIVPSFYGLLHADDLTKRADWIEKLQGDITALVQAADERGPYFLGTDLCLVDVHFAPFVLRLSRMLRDLRGWSDPMPGTRWQQYADALEHNPHVQATTSLQELYMETFDLVTKSRQPCSDA